MPRTSISSKPVPATSRIVRKPLSAPRSLRVVETADAGTGAGAGAGADCGEAAASSESSHRAFELACLPHQAEMYGIAMRICRDPDTAQDLVQETLLRAMCAWSSFQPGSNLRAWLFRILTNAFINGYRKRRRHQ